jgi:hypothetical protein
MNSPINTYKSVWLVDFEFIAKDGNIPKVVCLVAHDLVSGKTIRSWQDELYTLSKPPYDISNDSLFIAYYASAEFGCHLSLGWDLPVNVLDLFVEFRNKTNGISLPCGAGLVGALSYYGLDSIESAEKDSLRELIMNGGPWSDKEKHSILDYCESDVQSLAKLLPQMETELSIPHALLRGEYMKAAAKIEFIGIPIDTTTFANLKRNWANIQEKLIYKIAGATGIYDGLTFKAERFKDFLVERNIPWPLLSSGKLNLQDDTFKDMARSFPEVAPIRELRVALSQMRLSELPVGSDGRNRCLLSAFRSRTGRNQPSNNKFIFGPAVWLRGLIKPESGYALAYVDWSQQEFGIAASLSDDPLMKEAYLSGDPYLSFAKQAGAVPDDATKQTHKSEREQFKACVLAVQYGMGAEALAQRINQPVIRARELLRIHKQTYKVFWSWSDSAVYHAMLHGKLWTTFGWTIHTNQYPNPRFLRNFLMQANGAEMLRLACINLTKAGIRICAPVHDAVLIEAPVNKFSKVIKQTKRIMADSSASILDGFKLRSDVDEVIYPERYQDERGKTMWVTVMELLAECNMEVAS